MSKTSFRECVMFFSLGVTNVNHTMNVSLKVSKSDSNKGSKVQGARLLAEAHLTPPLHPTLVIFMVLIYLPVTIVMMRNVFPSLTTFVQVVFVCKYQSNLHGLPIPTSTTSVYVAATLGSTFFLLNNC
jgi:hypothetical protein